MARLYSSGSRENVFDPGQVNGLDQLCATTRFIQKNKKKKKY